MKKHFGDIKALKVFKNYGLVTCKVSASTATKWVDIRLLPTIPDHCIGNAMKELQKAARRIDNPEIQKQCYIIIEAFRATCREVDKLDALISPRGVHGVFSGFFADAVDDKYCNYYRR